MNLPNFKAATIYQAFISPNGKYCRVYEQHYKTRAALIRFYNISLDNYHAYVFKKDIDTVKLMTSSNSILVAASSNSNFIEFDDVLYVARKRILRHKLSIILLAIFRTDTSRNLVAEHRKDAKKINKQLQKFGAINSMDLEASLKRISPKIKLDSGETIDGRINLLLQMAFKEKLGYTHHLIRQVYKLIENYDKIKDR